MFNKNDPLIGSVQKVMQENAKRRLAVKQVNEQFGVYDRKALPTEKLAAYDSALAEATKKILSESTSDKKKVSKGLKLLNLLLIKLKLRILKKAKL